MLFALPRYPLWVRQRMGTWPNLSTSSAQVVCGRGKPLYPSVRLPFPHNLTPFSNSCLNWFWDGSKILSIFWSTLVFCSTENCMRVLPLLYYILTFMFKFRGVNRQWSVCCRIFLLICSVFSLYIILLFSGLRTCCSSQTVFHCTAHSMNTTITLSMNSPSSRWGQVVHSFSWS
jgi:hypothetical protein